MGGSVCNIGRTMVGSVCNTGRTTCLGFVTIRNCLIDAFPEIPSKQRPYVY